MDSSAKPAKRSRPPKSTVPLGRMPWSQKTTISNSSSAQAGVSNASPGTHPRHQIISDPNAEQDIVSSTTNFSHNVPRPRDRPTSRVADGIVGPTSATGPASIPRPKPKRTLHIHELFQSGLPTLPAPLVPQSSHVSPPSAYCRPAFDSYQQYHHWQQQRRPHTLHSPHLHIYDSPLQPSSSIPSAQPRLPSTSLISITSPRTPAQAQEPPVSTTSIQLHDTSSTPTSTSTSTKLNTAAAVFVPRQSLIHPRSTAVLTSTPDGNTALLQNHFLPLPKVSTGMGQSGVHLSRVKSWRPLAMGLKNFDERGAKLVKEGEESEKRELRELDRKENEQLEREADEEEEEEKKPNEKKRGWREVKRAEREERERLEREAKEKEVQEWEEREQKEQIEREERKRVEKEKAEVETEVEEARLKAGAEVEANAKERSQAVNEIISPQTFRRRLSGWQAPQGITRTESPPPAAHHELNNFGHHQPSENEDGMDIFDLVISTNSKDDAGRLVVECLEVCLGTENFERGTAILQTLPNDYQYIFVEKSIAVVFSGGIRSFSFFEELFARIYAQRICTQKTIERGFLPAVESADETSMDLPRTYEWLARLMYAAGLTKPRVDRLSERIVVTREPKLHPRYLLVYEYEKLLY